MPATGTNVLVYQWELANIPGFATAKNPTVNSDMWKKQNVLSWDVEESEMRTTNGTWRIYRYPQGETSAREEIKRDIQYDTRTYTDADTRLEFDKAYTYEVSFVPKGTAEERSPYPKLTKTVNGTITRSFDITNLNLDESEKSIKLTWNSPQFKGTDSYSFDILRTTKVSADGKYSEWKKIATIPVDDKTAGTYTYEDQQDLQTCHVYYYKVQTTMLGGKTFSLIDEKIKGGRLTGLSEVTSVSATKGDYNGLVKLSWEAKQIGTDATKFEVFRRLKGSSSWASIYKTQGNEEVYYYEDNTAQPGHYYDYRVMSVTACGEGEERTETHKDIVTEGFCRATGIVSGRIAYGTGTAVGGVKVRLVKSSDNAGDSTQYYSMRVDGMGSGVHLDLADDVFEEKFNKSAFTAQMFVNPDFTQTGTTPTLFDIGNIFSLTLGSYNEEKRGFQLCYALDAGAGQAASVPTEIYLPASEFSSLTISKAADKSVTLTMIDKNDSVNTATFSINALNGETSAGFIPKITFGGSNEEHSSVEVLGYIDEMRLFAGKALTKDEILANYNHTLSGTEDGLFAYWPVDEGIEAQTTAYDYSKSSGVANGNHGTIGVSTKPSTVIPTDDQLSLFALTDLQGNFVIRGVPFSGDGTNYTVVPQYGIHEFTPTYSTRYVSASSLVHSGIDFSDTSSFPVSGFVYYEGTDYPVEGCNFYVDGTVCSKDGEMISSAADGSFTISVPIGDHFIQVKKNGHTFVSDGRFPADPNDTGEKRTFDQELSNLTFTDNTLVNFTGKVVGGDIEGNKPVGFGQSKNNIGVTEIVMKPVNEKYRMNVVRKESGTVVSYEANPDTVPCVSATDYINSEAWRGKADDSQSVHIRTDKATGEFSVMLPPLMYKVQSMKVVATEQSVGDMVVIDMTNPLVENVDTMNIDGTQREYTYNAKMNQVYHVTPSFTVKQKDREDGSFGLDKYTVNDANGKAEINDIYSVADGKVTYKYGGAIFQSESNYTFLLEGYEEYVNSDDSENPITSRVPLIGSIVSIENGLSAGNKVYVEGNNDGKQPGEIAELEENELQLDSLGKATYTWKAGFPNIVAPYTRNLGMTYTVADRSYTWEGMTGIILGSLPTGNNFVTGGPDVVDVILRDPPGTSSYASWTKGTVHSRSKTSGRVWSSDTGALTETSLGLKTEIAAGFGVMMINSVDVKNLLSVGLNAVVEGEDASTWSTATTATKTVSTSSAPEYVGANGDVFVGSATNLVYGDARNVDFRRKGTTDEFELNLKDVITTGLQFGTGFSYTANHIENTLIPNLINIRNSKLQTVKSVDGFKNDTQRAVYVTLLEPTDEKFGSSNHDKAVWGDKATPNPSSQGESYTMIVPQTIKNCADSVEWYNSQIRIWKQYLEQNEREKVEAYESRDKYLVENLSFESGASVTKSTETEETQGSVYEVTAVGLAKIGFSTGININSIGVIGTIQTVTGGGTHDVTEGSDTELTGFTYTLAETGDDDAITVDVYNYGAYGPVFRTRGGQTSGPYEGEVKTQYHRPGTTIMEATMQIEVPKIEVERATVTNVPTGSAANFTLKMRNESETGEDVYYKLMQIDESNPNGAKITIDGTTLTDGRIIKIPSGTEVQKAMQITQTNLGVLDYKDIGIVLASQSQYDPTSTWEQIADTVYVTAQFIPSSSAVNMKLSNTTINTVTKSKLTITLDQFDRSYHNLKAFRIQYRKQGSTDWTLLKEYAASEQYKTDNNELLPDGPSVAYTLDMNDYTDGSYVFRVLSVSQYGNDEATNTSQEIAVIKDMQTPRALGTPEPTNGILSVGKDLSVTFNESILKDELTNQNFIVSGVVNGANVAHGTALRMSNADETASTDADIMLAGKDFSIDAWVNVKGKGTLVSHGNGAAKFTIGVNEKGQMTVGIRGNTYTSEQSMPLGKWAYMSLSYEKADDGGILNAAVVQDITTTRLFKNISVSSYDGIGKLSVGRDIDAAMHELTLWDEAHNVDAALLAKDKSKSPATQHLIGYWKMNEGEGVKATDYVRNRHLNMAAETWYLDNVNKAVALDGNAPIAIPIAHCSPLNEDDYAVELWMRAGKQQGDAQILSSGDIGLWLAADGQLRLTSGDETFTAGTAALNDNAWHHVALNVLRTGNAAVYVDGTRTLATSAANVGNIASANMLIGARNTAEPATPPVYDRKLIGEVGEVLMWNATMNASTINANRKLRLTGSESGLVAYYPFEKNGVDEYGQADTTPTDADMTGTENTATNGSVLTYTDEAPALRVKPTETNIKFSYTASEDKIVLSIDEDPAIIEGCTLNFTVKDVRDVNGNLSSPVTWSAYVKRNELVWKENTVSITNKTGEGASFTSTIVNNGSKQQMWTLSGMPSWLKASVEDGTTEALSESAIAFTVSDGTPVGKYEETIYLTGNDQMVAPLTVSVTVNGEKPAWSVDPTAFENNMSLIGSLSISGLPSSDADDTVAAFIGDECRGVAQPKYNKRYDCHFIMMDIYGNAADRDKPVTFKAYDASTGITYPVVENSEDTKFASNGMSGSYQKPVELNAVDVIEQSQVLNSGWNWTSMYVVADDMSVPTVFADIADDVSVVKGKTSFITRDNGSWHGNGVTLNNKDMFKVKMVAQKDLKTVGKRPDDAQRTITVEPGWNWIAYNGTTSMSVTDALAGLSPQDGDVVKGQTGFAIFDGYEWNGTLVSLTPGQGYILKSVSDQSRTFTYPSTTAGTVKRLMMMSRSRAATRVPTAFTPVDYHKYSGNINIVGKVKLDGVALADTEIGVFAGEECRTAAVTDADGMAYLTVPGDAECELTFRIMHKDKALTGLTTVGYVDDEIKGSPTQPLLIEFDSTVTGIDGIEVNITDTRWYDINGNVLPDKPYKQGIYIKRYTDPNTLKEVVEKVVIH